MLDELEHDARLMLDFALARGADGTVKVRVPFALRDAHRMRCDLIRLALAQAEAAWSVERAHSFFDAVVQPAGEESPPTASAASCSACAMWAENPPPVGFDVLRRALTRMLVRNSREATDR